MHTRHARACTNACMHRRTQAHTHHTHTTHTHTHTHTNLSFCCCFYLHPTEQTKLGGCTGITVSVCPCICASFWKRVRKCDTFIHTSWLPRCNSVYGKRSDISLTLSPPLPIIFLGRKDYTYTCKVNVFWTYNESAFSTVHFDVGSLYAGEIPPPPTHTHIPPSPQSNGLQISHFIPLVYDVQKMPGSDRIKESWFIFSLLSNIYMRALEQRKRTA